MEKRKSNGEKKNLIRTKRESNKLKMIVTISILLVAAIIYYIVDSGSYVAVVDGNRISRAEYQFFLSQQKSVTEQENDVYNKTDEEKKTFWLTVDGQNPWETAKSKALDSAKDYMIQLIKAKELGLKVNAGIKSEVAGFLESTKRSMNITSDKQFSNYIKLIFGITPNQFSEISEKLMLIDKFKESYLNNQFKPADLTEEDLKTHYYKDPKQFDSVDIRYILLTKLDEEGKKLSDEQIKAKQKTAEEVLEKIKQGNDIDKVITDYTEETPDTSSDQPLGSSTIIYYEGSELSEWVFEHKVGDSGIINFEEQILVTKIEKRTTFDDMKNTVRTTMQNEEKENFYEEALSNWSMETKYNIIKNDRIYDSFSYK